MRIPFSKPAISHAEQVALLQSRGMEITDTAHAEFVLSHLNYYRLCGYWLPFESDHSTHQFRSGTTFTAVLSLYNFDRELRLLLLNAIERIEVSVRSQWAYQLAHLYGPHAHLRQPLFDPRYWSRLRDDLADEVNRSGELFIQHMITTYSDDLPPIWAICEVMSLGLLSRSYSNLQPMLARRAIADPYDVDEFLFQSWLHHLVLVRNLCAHHSRLWNRDFAITPALPRRRPTALPAEFMTGSRKIYNTLVILIHFMDTIAPGHAFRDDLKRLVAKYDPPTRNMGFPADWQSRAIWREVAV